MNHFTVRMPVGKVIGYSCIYRKGQQMRGRCLAHLIGTLFLGKQPYNHLQLLLTGHTEIQGYLDIPGWLQLPEALALYDIATSLPQKDAQLTIVEIGSFLGKSSIVLAKALKQYTPSSVPPHKQLFCIDPFDASRDSYSTEKYQQYAKASINLKDKFLDNLRRNNVLDVVQVLEGYSHEFAEDFDRKIDLLFIDGDHSYESVLDDYRCWAPKIRHGGYLAFHDVDPSEAHQGPWQVVARYVLTHPDEWALCAYVRQLLVVRRVGTGIL